MAKPIRYELSALVDPVKITRNGGTVSPEGYAEAVRKMLPADSLGKSFREIVEILLDPAGDGANNQYSIQERNLVGLVRSWYDQEKLDKEKADGTEQTKVDLVAVVYPDTNSERPIELDNIVSNYTDILHPVEETVGGSKKVYNMVMLKAAQITIGGTYLDNCIQENDQYIA
ncbi:MAG: hypothetical protein PHT54_05180 [Candidatus Nanoarchaeia archaeon]|nr:hypothetical protein [Candidatus Nanoarchaeia archaeon]